MCFVKWKTTLAMAAALLLLLPVPAQAQQTAPDWYDGYGFYDLSDGTTVYIAESMLTTPGREAEIQVNIASWGTQAECRFQVVDDWGHVPANIVSPTFLCSGYAPEQNVPTTGELVAMVDGLQWVMEQFGWTEVGTGQTATWWNVGFTRGMTDDTAVSEGQGGWGDESQDPPNWHKVLPYIPEPIIPPLS